MRPLLRELGIEREAGLGQLRLEPGAPPGAGVEPVPVLLHVPDESDPPVTELQQVPRRHPPALDVVDGDGGKARVRPVDQHDGDIGRLELRDLGVPGRERHAQDAVQPPAQGAGGEPFARLLGSLHIEEHELVARARERVSRAAQALDDRRLGEERSHDADRHRAAGRQRPRPRVRAVVERVDRREHPAAGALADGR